MTLSAADFGLPLEMGHLFHWGHLSFGTLKIVSDFFFGPRS